MIQILVANRLSQSRHYDSICRHHIDGTSHSLSSMKTALRRGEKYLTHLFLVAWKLCDENFTLSTSLRGPTPKHLQLKRSKRFCSQLKLHYLTYVKRNFLLAQDFLYFCSVFSSTSKRCMRDAQLNSMGSQTRTYGGDGWNALARCKLDADWPMADAAIAAQATNGIFFHRISARARGCEFFANYHRKAGEIILKPRTRNANYFQFFSNKLLKLSNKIFDQSEAVLHGAARQWRHLRLRPK